MAETEEPQVPILSRLKPPAGAVKRRRRIGRGPGSGLGKTSGKGQKGQKSRSGGSIHPWFEGGQTPLQRRLPKVGFHNPFSKTIVTVNVSALARFDAGATVGPEELRAAGLIRKRYDGVKILGSGTLDKALTVRAHAFSKGAKSLIEGAGGTAEVIDPKAAAPAAASES
ncbi:MAG: 50S ribosomal protein L15 [Myxococcales bacterium]|nr:50S ribosomal protein L15 [Myxococcales bacterium]